MNSRISTTHSSDRKSSPGGTGPTRWISARNFAKIWPNNGESSTKRRRFVYISYYSILVWAIQLTEMCFVYLFTGGDETLGSGTSTQGRGVDATFRGLDPNTAGLVIRGARTGDCTVKDAMAAEGSAEVRRALDESRVRFFLIFHHTGN